MEDKKFVCDICGQEFCNISLKANHVRWEHKTPDRLSHHSQKWFDAMKRRRGIATGIAKEHKLYTCCHCGKVWETTKEGHTVHEKFCKENPNKVVYKSHKHTEETKRELSEMALNNHYRRIMRHTVEFHGFLCDSTWEVEMIKKFEELNEPFIKPDPIAYIDDNGKQHQYFPDFFLPNKNLIIEVKNPYLFEHDRKVQILKETVQNIIWITSLNDIKNFKLD